jgi:hypothetical protein
MKKNKIENVRTYDFLRCRTVEGSPWKFAGHGWVFFYTCSCGLDVTESVLEHCDHKQVQGPMWLKDDFEAFVERNQ